MNFTTTTTIFYLQACLSSPARDLASVLLLLRPNRLPKFSDEKSTCSSKTTCNNSQNAAKSTRINEVFQTPSNSSLLDDSQKAPLDISQSSQSRKSAPPQNLRFQINKCETGDCHDHLNEVRMAKKCDIQGDFLGAYKQNTKRGLLYVVESESSKADEESKGQVMDGLIIRYWKALQSKLAHAGIDLQVVY